jgi:hypothetical protein
MASMPVRRQLSGMLAAPARSPGRTSSQPVLRQPDAAGAHVGLDLGVLHGVETVPLKQGFQGVRGAGGSFLAARQQVVEELLHHAGEIRLIAAGGGEVVQFGAARGRQQAGLGAHQRGHGQGVISRRHERPLALQQAALGAAFVDGEVVDHRLHGEGHGVFQAALGFAHDALHGALRFGLAARMEQESHAAAGHAAQHPEAPEILAKRGPRAFDQAVGVKVAGPRNDGLDGPVEIPPGPLADPADVALPQAVHHFVQDADGLAARLPLALAAQQVALGDHLEDRSHVLRHAAVHQHQAVFELLARRGRNLRGIEDAVSRQQAAAADAEFGIALTGGHAVDQLDARPDAARILPAAARPADPFAQNGARGHQAPVGFLQAAGERVDLPGGAHAGRNQAGQQTGGNGQAAALGNVVDLGDDFDSQPRRARQPLQHARQRLGGAFHSGRHHAARDHGGFEQPQVIAREIEDLGHGGDFGDGAQIHAHQAQHRPVDDPHPGFHGRLGNRRVRARAHAQIHRDVEHARAFGEIHAQEKDVAPAAVAEVHAHRRRLAQDGIEAARAPQQFRAQAQRIVGRMAGAEHPLVAAHRAHAAAHLVGQRLEAQAAVSGGQRAGDDRPGAARAFGGQEKVDGLVEAAVQKVGVARIGNLSGRAGRRALWHVKPVDGVEEEQRAHAFVEVVARSAKTVERGALGLQLTERQIAADRVQRTVAQRGVACRDNRNQAAHGRFPAASSRSASSSRSCASTSARSWPLRASASCEVSRP